MLLCIFSDFITLRHKVYKVYKMLCRLPEVVDRVHINRNIMIIITHNKEVTSGPDPGTLKRGGASRGFLEKEGC